MRWRQPPTFQQDDFSFGGKNSKHITQGFCWEVFGQDKYVTSPIRMGVWIRGKGPALRETISSTHGLHCCCSQSELPCCVCLLRNWPHRSHQTFNTVVRLPPPAIINCHGKQQTCPFLYPKIRAPMLSCKSSLIARCPFNHKLTRCL